VDNTLDFDSTGFDDREFDGERLRGTCVVVTTRRGRSITGFFVVVFDGFLVLSAAGRFVAIRIRNIRRIRRARGNAC
jgi:hypothetical protein